MKKLIFLLAMTLFAQGLSVTTTPTLPAAWAFTVYSQTLAASGGQTPYTWSVTDGTLCTGLALSTAGVLSGAPTVGGTYAFTVKVTDALNATASKLFTLSVKGPATSISGGVAISGKVVMR